MKMGLLTEALEDLDEAVALCNNSTTIYYNRALCHQKMRHFKEVLSHLLVFVILSSITTAIAV